VLHPASADAGADLHSWRDEGTGYNLVQTAANMQDVDAALQLVEAGCKWQLPKGQRVLGNAIFYAPEILTTHSPNLKVNPAQLGLCLAESASVFGRTDVPCSKCVGLQACCWVCSVAFGQFRHALAPSTVLRVSD
jgi:hypothetical protein